MTIPDFQSLMLPIMKIASDKQEHNMREIIETLASEFKLSEDERTELLPSGRQARFDNRMGWAVTHLRRAGLLETIARGKYQISQRGLDVLAQKPERIDMRVLNQFDEFKEFRAKRDDNGEEVGETIVETETPEEAIESVYQTLRQNLANDILSKVKNGSPKFFETLVVDLLIKMGYGGTRQEAGKAIGKSGDEGIDGIINEDRLGLDVIYIQAKRWENQIGRPEIQKFAGALQGQHAKKGIFITTSYFTKEAMEFASRVESKIILIDGAHLAQLMIDYGVGVNLVASYELKRIDSDYFEE